MASTDITDLPPTDHSVTQSSQPVRASRAVAFWPTAAACGCSCVALVVGIWLGVSWLDDRGNAASHPDALQAAMAELNLPPILASSASATDSMAVATGPISEDAEGIFFLDFITGDLQCLVYYPRAGAFGARYFGNVIPQLGGGGKNSKYIMVTGQAIVPAATAGARPGASLVYVTDVTSGTFAAYAVPWDRNAEQSGRIQTAPLLYVGGGPIRNFQLRDPRQNQPAGIVDPNKNP